MIPSCHRDLCFWGFFVLLLLVLYLCCPGDLVPLSRLWHLQLSFSVHCQSHKFPPVILKSWHLYIVWAKYPWHLEGPKFLLLSCCLPAVSDPFPLTTRLLMVWELTAAPNMVARGHHAIYNSAFKEQSRNTALQTGQEGPWPFHSQFLIIKGNSSVDL